MPYRILILNYEYPPLGGGAGIITRHLANELAEMNCEVTILTTLFKDLKEDEQQGNIRIIRLPAMRKRLDRSNVIEMYSYMRAARDYVKRFKKDQFDVCIANFSLPGGFVAMKMKEEIGLPYVVVSHGHDIPWFFPAQMFFWHLSCYRLIKRVCKQAERLILLTDEMKKIADNFMDETLCHKNIVIPNGIHEMTFNYGEKPHDRLKILFVGRLVDQKDPMLFMRIVKQLKDTGMDFEARVFGGGQYKKKMLQYKETHALTEVEFAGKVPHKEVIDAMMASHVLVAPSKHEAMSVTILEGLSCGLYIVTTPISGNNMVVENNGILIDSRDAEPYAEAITAYNEDVFKQGAFKRQQVSEHILQEFNWRVVAERYMLMFKRILGDKAS